MCEISLQQCKSLSLDVWKLFMQYASSCAQHCFSSFFSMFRFCFVDHVKGLKEPSKIHEYQEKLSWNILFCSYVKGLKEPSKNHEYQEKLSLDIYVKAHRQCVSSHTQRCWGGSFLTFLHVRILIFRCEGVKGAKQDSWISREAVWSLAGVHK